MTAINPKAIRGPVTAVPVVAGKGIRFVEDVENNRVVAEVDETVLYNYPSSENAYNTSRKLISFSESCRNFERIRIYLVNNDGAMDAVEVEPGSDDHTETFQLNTISNEPRLYVKMTTWVLSASSLTYRAGSYYYIINGTASLTDPTVNKTINYVVPYKVIGINRIANN